VKARSELEVIPVDGTVSDGEAVVDQHALTGESVPVEKTVGSKIYASTLLIGGRILVAVEQAGKETTTTEEVNGLFRHASNSTLKGILGYEELPLVSVDFRGDARSAIIDAGSTMVVGGTQVKCSHGTTMKAGTCTEW
jgi:magnesium-transporting ATPase (P-type)